MRKDIERVLSDISEEKGEKFDSELVEGFLQYSSGSFDKQVHEIYNKYWNYFLGFHELDRLMCETERRFNKYYRVEDS